jgi:hypothetical protein
MRAILLLSIGFAVLIPSWQARADGEDAEAQLRLGVELRRLHRNEEALDLFERALSSSPTPTARAQVALAEQALGRWLDAARDLSTALGATDDPWISKNYSALLEARAQIDGHLAWLTVNVDATGAEVEVGGRMLAVGTEGRVLAGTTRVDARATGHVPETRLLVLAPGAHAHVTLMLAPAPVVQPAPAPPASVVIVPTLQPNDAAESPGAPVGPAVLAAVGLAGLGAGTYFGLHALGEKSARDANCSAGACTHAALFHDADARKSAMVSTAAFSTGLASVAAGATWWLLDRRAAAHSVQGSRAPSVGPFVLGALGLAAVGAAIYSGVHAYAEKSARDAACSTGTCGPEALAHDTDARTSADISSVASGAAVVSLAAATILWTVEHSRRTRPPAGWRPVPRAGSGLVGISVEGEFE